MHRLADLDSATTIDDLVTQTPIALGGDFDGLLSIELADGIHLVFSANHNHVPLCKDGSVDWSTITRIKITRIGSIK